MVDGADCRPTTNLDQENINALAEALAEYVQSLRASARHRHIGILISRIIRERRRQANFQLIVITHDEGFLQRLAAHDVLEYYWYVLFLSSL
jgi:DNA repair protein RAD50